MFNDIAFMRSSRPGGFHLPFLGVLSYLFINKKEFYFSSWSLLVWFCHQGYSNLLKCIRKCSFVFYFLRVLKILELSVPGMIARTLPKKTVYTLCCIVLSWQDSSCHLHQSASTTCKRLIQLGDLLTRHSLTGGVWVWGGVSGPVPHLKLLRPVPAGHYYVILPYLHMGSWCQSI